MEYNHKRFLEHLDDSIDTVFIVAKYLYHKTGMDIKINSLERASKHSEWNRCKDDGDLYLFKDNISYRIEVKGLSCDFKNNDDWPFRDFIVCAKHSFDHADPKPYAYFILNKNRTHAAIVRTHTSDSWHVVERADKRYNNITQCFYICDFEHIEWILIAA